MRFSAHGADGLQCKIQEANGRHSGRRQDIPRERIQMSGMVGINVIRCDKKQKTHKQARSQKKAEIWGCGDSRDSCICAEVVLRALRHLVRASLNGTPRS